MNIKPPKKNTPYVHKTKNNGIEYIFFGGLLIVSDTIVYKFWQYENGERNGRVFRATQDYFYENLEEATK